MFGSIGGPELFLIFVVGLIVFGPRKLPEIGKSLGRMVAEFKKASSDFQRTVEDEIETERLKKDIASATDFEGRPALPEATEVKPAPVPAPVIREAEGTVPSSLPLEAEPAITEPGTDAPKA